MSWPHGDICVFCDKGLGVVALHGKPVCHGCLGTLFLYENDRRVARTGVRGADPATVWRGGRSCDRAMRFHDPRGAA